MDVVTLVWDLTGVRGGGDPFLLRVRGGAPFVEGTHGIFGLGVVTLAGDLIEACEGANILA